MALSIKTALDEAGIAIPFPQRTLRLGPGGTTLPLTQGEHTQAAPDG